MIFFCFLKILFLRGERTILLEIILTQTNIFYLFKKKVAASRHGKSLYHEKICNIFFHSFIILCIINFKLFFFGYNKIINSSLISKKKKINSINLWGATCYMFIKAFINKLFSSVVRYWHTSENMIDMRIFSSSLTPHMHRG